MSQRSILPSLWGKDDKGYGIQSLQRDLDRMLDEFKNLIPASMSPESDGKTGFLTPKIDVSESDSTVEIVAEIPGVDRDQIDVSVANEVLTIKGEKATEREETEKDYHLIERSSGSFYRSIPLGFDVDPERVESSFKDGVLTLKLEKPKELASKVKKIEIKSGA